MLLLGEELATKIGINASVKRRRYMALLALLTGGLGATCGIIRFMGIVMPHLVHAFTGVSRFSGGRKEPRANVPQSLRRAYGRRIHAAEEEHVYTSILHGTQGSWRLPSWEAPSTHARMVGSHQGYATFLLDVLILLGLDCTSKPVNIIDGITE